jgi:hypothetical protein
MPVRGARNSAAPPAPAPSPRGAVRPVLLATIGVPIDPEGERVAVETAVEAGARLVLVSLRLVPVAPLTVAVTGRDGVTLPDEEALEDVRATAARAAARGIETLLVRVGTRHPARALLEVTTEQDAGLLVLAPERGAMSARRLRRLSRLVRSRADCLLWVAPDGAVDSRRALL